MSRAFHATLSETAVTTSETIRALLVLPLCFGVNLLSRAASQAPQDRPQVIRIQLSLWRYRRLLSEAFESLDTTSVKAEIQSFAEHADHLKATFVAWVDLIELLVQRAEQSHGPRAGGGTLKKAEVKAVLHALADNGRLVIPGVLPALVPIVADVAIDWVIDTVVLQINTHGLWVDNDTASGTGRRWAEGLWHVLYRLLRPLFAFGTRIAAAIWRVSRPPVLLTNELKTAVEAIQRQAALNTGNAFEEVSRILIWIGTHRDALVASSELVYSAVKDAEAFLELSGPEKKAYARDLVWALLAESGLAPASGLLSAIVDSGVDFLIESSVRLFNKHGVFPHSGSHAAGSSLPFN